MFQIFIWTPFSSLALRKKAEIFWLNKREYDVIKNLLLGEVIMGYFKSGGSTVVLIFEKNKPDIDSDFLNNTKKALETTVK